MTELRLKSGSGRENIELLNAEISSENVDTPHSSCRTQEGKYVVVQRARHIFVPLPDARHVVQPEGPDSEQQGTLSPFSKEISATRKRTVPLTHVRIW